MTVMHEPQKPAYEAEIRNGMLMYMSLQICVNRVCVLKSASTVVGLNYWSCTGCIVIIYEKNVTCADKEWKILLVLVLHPISLVWNFDKYIPVIFM